MRVTVLSSIIIRFFSISSTAWAVADDVNVSPTIPKHNFLRKGNLAAHEASSVDVTSEQGCQTVGGDCSNSKCCSDGTTCTWSGINGSDRYYCQGNPTTPAVTPRTRERVIATMLWIIPVTRKFFGISFISFLFLILISHIKNDTRVLLYCNNTYHAGGVYLSAAQVQAIHAKAPSLYVRSPKSFLPGNTVMPMLIPAKMDMHA